MNFDKNGKLLPQKVNYTINHSEPDEEMIEKYINKKCEFRIEFDNKGDPIFKKKGKEG